MANIDLAAVGKNSLKSETGEVRTAVRLLSPEVLSLEFKGVPFIFKQIILAFCVRVHLLSAGICVNPVITQHHYF